MILKTTGVPAPEDVAPDDGRVEVVDEETGLVMNMLRCGVLGWVVVVL